MNPILYLNVLNIPKIIFFFYLVLNWAAYLTLFHWPSLRVLKLNFQKISVENFHEKISFLLLTLNPQELCIMSAATGYMLPDYPGCSKLEMLFFKATAQLTYRIDSDTTPFNIFLAFVTVNLFGPYVLFHNAIIAIYAHLSKPSLIEPHRF